MNRRTFFKSASLAGLGLTTLIVAACNKPSDKKGEPSTTDDSIDFPLNEFTIEDLQKKMVSGELTARSITEMYLKRIAAIDKTGPAINSVIELNPDALAIADALDNERKQGKLRGPLHGIPILIKDNINTADKMMTTAGSLALEGNKAATDAFIVDKLRQAGAVLLGKTNLSEWANFRSTRSTSGWSSRGGQTKNPYSLDRNPCGSSSGTGAAIAANLCAIGIGTETNGSIACPSSVNGIVGIKPTVGLWSRNGIIPISKTQDTAGPMTRTVRDAAILLGALSGFDPEDPATTNLKDKPSVDYVSALDPAGLKRKRIGIEKSLIKGHEGVDALLQKAMDQMRSQGATIIEVELLKALDELEGEELSVLKYEFKAGLNHYLETAHAAVKSLKDVIAFNKTNESKVMPFFKQEILESSEQLGGLESKQYKNDLEKLTRVTRGSIEKLFRENRLDAICGPTDGPTWCTDPINGDAFTGYGFYSPAAVAGYPSISVPMGMVFDLPIGLLFFGLPYSEAQLISVAYSYEQKSKNRVKPAFRKTTPSLAS